MIAVPISCLPNDERFALQLDNIMLHGMWPYPAVKLCDFGFSKAYDLQSACKTTCGTAEYICPEVRGAAIVCNLCADDGTTVMTFHVPLLKFANHTHAAAMAQHVRPHAPHTLGLNDAQVLTNGKNTSYDGTIADAWSAGVVLHALLNGAFPFARNDGALNQVL